MIIANIIIFNQSVLSDDRYIIKHRWEIKNYPQVMCINFKVIFNTVLP